MAPTLVASYAAHDSKRCNIAASGEGPALVHGHVIRPYSHSLSDDERAYRSEAELEADALRDPIASLQAHLPSRERILDESALKPSSKREVDAEVQHAAGPRPRRRSRLP